jgi:acyl-CoA thioesterase FadM
MVILTTPRTVFSIGKGLLKRSHGGAGPAATASGIGSDNPHVYTARAGVFDVDYLGHMNNAMYLSHAELARWEWTAYNGMLSAMAKKNLHFLVKGSCIRYRQEIRPVFRRFQIDSCIAGLDEKHFWITQKFRYSSEDRVRAQVMVQGVAVKGRQVLNPSVFLKDMGMDTHLVESLILPNVPNATVEKMLECYVALEDAMRAEVSEDDALRGTP